MAVAWLFDIILMTHCYICVMQINITDLRTHVNIRFLMPYCTSYMRMPHLMELLCLVELPHLVVTSCGNFISSGMSHLMEIIISTGNLGI